MKVTCLQESLNKGLDIVGRAVSTHSIRPSLGNVLLATDDGRLRLSATNLQVCITYWLQQFSFWHLCDARLAKNELFCSPGNVK